MCVDRFGGVESVQLLDIRELGGKCYPERRPWRIFSRTGHVLNRPLIYPAIRYLREQEDGSIRVFAPEYPDIHASAVLSPEYDMLMGEDGFAHRLRDSLSGERRAFLCAISKPHWYEHREAMSNYNQLAHEWLPAAFRSEGFDECQPIRDGKVELLREAPAFDAGSNSLGFRLTARGEDFEKELHVVFTSDVKLGYSEDVNQWLLRSDFLLQREGRFACGIGPDRSSALANAQEMLRDMQTGIDAQIHPGRFPSMPEISIEDMPLATEFSRVFPYYQSALCLAETETEMCIRAAFSKFGFFAIWDHIYPIRDFLVAGEWHKARKALRYMMDFPHTETNPFVLSHLTIALNEYLAFTGDLALLHEGYASLKKAFAFAQTLLDQDTGLLRYAIDTAVDVMPELGLDGLFYASCVNGWWYDCCCCLVNFAMIECDSAFETTVKEIERKISASYEEVFYDEKSGWLKAAVGEDRKQMNCDVFLQNKTLAADYAHGAWILRHIRKNMASYLMKHLHHPMGVSAVAFDSQVPAIYLKGTRMNQHIGHSCKMLRQANRMDGVEHLLSNYLYVYGRTQNAVETFNYSFCLGNQTQLADWQAFSATAAMQAIIQGRIGLAWHRGGLHFVPAADDKECAIRNFHFRDKIYDLSITGQGGFIGGMSFNGREITGTAQLPADLPRQERNSWQVERTANEPPYPVLLWMIDIPIIQVSASAGHLIFKTASGGFAKMECFVPGNPILTINGKKVEYEYDEKEKSLWFTGDVNEGDVFEINLREKMTEVEA